jgi:hypothetical protein
VGNSEDSAKYTLHEENNGLRMYTLEERIRFSFFPLSTKLVKEQLCLYFDRKLLPGKAQEKLKTLEINQDFGRLWKVLHNFALYSEIPIR